MPRRYGEAKGERQWTSVIGKESITTRKSTLLRRRLFVLVGVIASIALIVYGNAKRISEGKVGIPVRTVTVTRKDISFEISAKGVVEAQRKARIRSEITGLVKAVTVKVGDEVKRGQPLVFFDEADLETRRDEAERSLREAESNLSLLKRRKENWVRLHQAELEQARAQLEQVRLRTKATEGLPPWEEGRALALEELREAEARVKLIEAQAESDKVTDEEVAAAQAAVVSARAALERAEGALSKLMVRSSDDGIVTAVKVEEGDAVSEGSLLIEVADLNALLVRTKVDEIDIARIDIKAPARVMSKAYPDSTFHGIVSEISPEAVREDNVGYFDVTVGSLQASGSTEKDALRPGMSVDVKILAERKSNAVVVPAEAVLSEDEVATGPSPENRAAPSGPVKGKKEGSRDTGNSAQSGDDSGFGRSFVFVEEEGIARLKEVRLGIDTGTEVEVLNGLTGGEVLIVGDYETLRNLKDGDKVRRVAPEDTVPKDR